MQNGPFDLGGLTAVELGKRVWAEISADNVWDAAAQLGYYFLLALFPMLIFLLSLVALVPDYDLVGSLLGALQSVMPSSAFDLVGAEIQRILESSTGGLLTFGMLGTIWAASSGVVSLIGTINRAYEVEEKRGFLKLRLAAVGITVALVVLLVTGGVLLTTGDAIVEWAAALLGLDWVARIAGTAISYVLGFALLFAALELVYYFGPDLEDQKWHWITPGSLVGVLLFVAASIGFTLYLRFNDSYSVTYGSIGAVIVLMLWLYLLGLSIVVGAEVNSEIAIAAKAHGREDAPDDAGQSDTERKAADTASGDDGTRVVVLPRPEHMSPEVYGLVLSDLLGALVHENARVRAATARMLAHLDPPHPAVEALLKTRLEDEDEEVRTEARRALERMRRAA
jgi:membrane protein